MVRLMHSMVRFNVLNRGDRWDPKIYGVPIPQIDQMPVALLSSFPLALEAVRRGRTTFTPAGRARVELGRYRGFLLGLPRELLAETPQSIVTIMLTRFATLRKGFDETCAALVAATMAADLMPDRSFASRANAWMEHGFSKAFFVKRTMRGNRPPPRRSAYGSASRINSGPRGRHSHHLEHGCLRARRAHPWPSQSRRSLARRKLIQQLVCYGHAEFRTNAEAYRPVELDKSATKSQVA